MALKEFDKYQKGNDVQNTAPLMNYVSKNEHDMICDHLENVVYGEKCSIF